MRQTAASPSSITSAVRQIGKCRCNQCIILVMMKKCPLWLVVVSSLVWFWGKVSSSQPAFVLGLGWGGGASGTKTSVLFCWKTVFFQWQPTQCSFCNMNKHSAHIMILHPSFSGKYCLKSRCLAYWFMISKFALTQFLSRNLQTPLLTWFLQEMVPL